MLDYELDACPAGIRWNSRPRRGIRRRTRLALSDLARDDPQLADRRRQGHRRLAAAWHQEWAKPLVQWLRAGNPIPVDGPLAAEEGERRFQLVEGAVRRAGSVRSRRAGRRSRRRRTPTRKRHRRDRRDGQSVVRSGLTLLVARGLAPPVDQRAARPAEPDRGQASFAARRSASGPNATTRSARSPTVLEQLRLRRRATATPPRGSDAERSATYNKLAELISFSSTEEELVDAAIRAIRRLTSIPSGDVELANPSQNRLVYAAVLGRDRPVEIGRPCRSTGWTAARASAARRRTSSTDVEDELAVRCPAHTTTSGAAACVPMMALGQVMGVIHLSFPDDGQATATVGIVTRGGRADRHRAGEREVDEDARRAGHDRRTDRSAQRPFLRLVPRAAAPRHGTRFASRSA